MSDEPESIYRIATDGCVTALQLEPGQELGRIYAAALECKYFTVVGQHRVAGSTSVDGESGYMLLLLGDEEAQLRGSAPKTPVSEALGATF